MTQLPISRREVVCLIAADCNAFADEFLEENCRAFLDLDSPEADHAEQRHEWYQAFRRFTDEAEIRLLNAVTMWGMLQPGFDRDFLEAAQCGGALSDFLALTEYTVFVSRMYERVLIVREREAQGLPAPVPAAVANLKLPATADLKILDQKLRDLDKERTKLLLERRRLVGCAVEPLVSANLKREIELLRYREEVGLD